MIYTDDNDEDIKDQGGLEMNHIECNNMFSL